TVGPDGSSHQAIEDIALMRLLPNMNIIVPCDGPQTRDAILTAVRRDGPFYIRLGRAKVPTLETKNVFEFGKAQVLNQSGQVTIIACGIMVAEALVAAKNLVNKGISVRLLNMHTICPLDTEAILDSARNTKGIVVCEEHSVVGGLAQAVDEVVAQNHPVKVLRVGVKHRFGQSGEPQELLKEYNLTSSDIEKAACSLVF
ncbi:MAG: transketolase C-terminal domain-containing protein, partial [Candidatus Omnitrophota bacterium]